ncbi:unnamed protein product [Urochloa decumbens]|uniref:F-box protein n=1 Tax=Urochloa decumbens TaxID=240449 RepID=A0ABC9BKG9_9POAL
MRGAELACTAWRSVAVGDPALCRRADLTTARTRYYASSLAMARAAADRSAGQCVAFSGTLDANSLLYLVERAPLKSLNVQDIVLTDKVVNVAVALKKLPLLEDLEISTDYYNTQAENLFASVCKACPHLKKLRLTFPEPECDIDGDREIQDGGVCEIPIMCELRSIELFEFDLTADGLAVILENCPLLETLHIDGYFLGNNDGTYEELREKCAARVKNLTLPEPDIFEDYDSDLD